MMMKTVKIIMMMDSVPLFRQMSYNMVWMCNRLNNLRLLVKDEDPLQVRTHSRSPDQLQCGLVYQQWTAGVPGGLCVRECC